ncbi:MAG: hypothetical protein IT381_17495 [Deltaproteobacteria bacterium]|nr:hypothetical protein [Deltaproteobacteria bacterium]
MRLALSMLVVCLVARDAFAAKSNQLRPTPSPIQNSRLDAGQWLFAPRFVYTNYSDTTPLPTTPATERKYAISSLGLQLEAQIGLARWFSLTLGLEGYAKIGSITGPSPGDITQNTEADVTGYAFKLAVQTNFRVFSWGPDRGQPNPGNIWIYVYARGIADLFRQQQVEPLARTDFAEQSFEYRAGVAVHLHIWRGIFIAAFGGVDGVVFGGNRTDTAPAGTTTFASAETPFPYFGGDLLWAPPWSGGRFDDAISLGAILALTSQDTTGYGGTQWTINLGYSFVFDWQKKEPAASMSTP